MKAAKARNMLTRVSISPHTSAFAIERTRLGESKEDERQTPGADVKRGVKPHQASLKVVCHRVAFPTELLERFVTGHHSGSS